MVEGEKGNKPMNRFCSLVGGIDHPIKIGCYPNCISDEFETTPCFNRVNIDLNLDHLTASAVSNWKEL